MKGRILYSYLLVWLCMAGLSTHSYAQTPTILTGNITPTSVCPGGNATVSFTISGTFAAANTFSAQLSDASGTFAASPTVIGTLPGAVAGSIFVTIPTSIGSGVGYRIRIVSSNSVRTGSVSAQALTISTPFAPGVTSPLTYCVGQSASPLTATPGTGGTLNWYGTNSSGGTASSVAPTPSTSTAGSTTYYVSQTQNGCEGPRASITVVVNAIPSAPSASSPSPYCEGSSASALTATGQNLLWYGTNSSGGSGSGSATVPSTAASAIGNTLYYVSQTVNGCESARTSISVQVKDTPNAPGTSAIDFCQGASAPTLTASLVSGATPNWYGTNSSGGTPSSSPPVAGNSSAGTTVYYVSQTINGCESPRAGLSVRVKAIPGAPTVSPVSFCNNGPAQPLTASGSSLKWFDGSDNLLGGTPTPSTSTVGNLTFKVSQTVESCEGPKATLTVTINPIPAAPSGSSPSPYCEGSSAQPLTATGQNLLWYGTNSSGGSGSGSATVPSTAASAIGSTFYYVSQTVNGCESGRTSISVQVKDTPDAPGTSAIDFCQGTGAPTLTASLVNGATPNWYGTNSSGGSASSTPPVPSNSNVGTTFFYVSQTLVGCEGPRASLSVRVKLTPSAPGVNSVSFCNRSQTQQLSASGSNLKWFDGSDNLLGGAPTPSSDAVGNQTYKVSQTIENCEGPKANISVTIKPLPGQPNVQNPAYCQSQEDQPQQNVTSLAANVSGQNLKWYTNDNQTLGSAPIPTISQAGVQTYKVSQTVDGCEGDKASIQITIYSPSTPVTPKSVVTYCIGDKAVPLEASGEATGQLRWIDPYGTVSNNAPTPSTLNTNIKPEGDPFYVYQIVFGCYSARSTIRVVVNTTPTLSLLAPVANVNLGLKAPLQLKFTGAGPYSYTVTGGYSGTARSDTTILVLPRGNTQYQVTTVSNGCGIGLPGNPATAIITVRVPTVSTSSLASSTLCAGTSLSVPFTTTGEFNPGNAFRIEMVSVADTSKKYAIPASAGNSPITSSLPTTLPGGQYYVRVKADNPEIAITGSNSPTLLTVRSFPTATLTGTQNIYEGMPVNLTFTFGGDGPWNVTYADSLRSYPLTATTNPYVVEARPARTTTYRLTGVTNSCGTGTLSGTAVITVLPLLGVDDNSLDPLVKAYPVPTQTTLIVELNLPLTHDPATLSLTDLRGQPILQHTTRNRLNELNLASQPSGLYILHIQVGDRQTVRKVLKQ